MPNNNDQHDPHRDYPIEDRNKMLAVVAVITLLVCLSTVGYIYCTGLHPVEWKPVFFVIAPWFITSLFLFISFIVTNANHKKIIALLGFLLGMVIVCLRVGYLFTNS